VARTLRAIELAQFGACRHEQKSIFGLAYEMMVEAAIEAWPTGKTITCPLHILVVLLSGNNMNHWLRSGEQYMEHVLAIADGGTIWWVYLPDT